jgi:DNA-binding NarL/FixJ family response regulator
MISIAIVEDHQLLVDSMKFLIRSDAEFTFAGAASTLHEARDLIRNTSPDILLLDLGLPDGDGLELIDDVNVFAPETQVVVLTCLSDEYNLMRAIDRGVSGFVSKGSPLSELLAAIRKAAQGEMVIPPGLLVGLLKRLPREKSVVYKDEEVWERLTSREKEILYHLSRGKSGTAIADELNIAPLTVRTHVRNLMSKLGVHSRLEAVTAGMRYGLIEAPY